MVRLLLSVQIVALALLSGCGGDTDTSMPHADGGMTMTGVDASLARDGGDGGRSNDTYDIDGQPLPRIIAHDIIELGKISRISRFRSGIGHDYSDSLEHCRSMKHYFQPKSSVDWATVRIDAPLAGTVVRLDDEWAGKQLHLKSRDEPAFTVVVFHLQPDPSVALGSTVEAGQVLGTHVSNQTTSDVAVQANTPSGFRLVSYFDLVSDQVLATYQARGVTDRKALIIDKAERDTAPLVCMGEAFVTMGTLQNWVDLN